MKDEFARRTILLYILQCNWGLGFFCPWPCGRCIFFVEKFPSLSVDLLSRDLTKRYKSIIKWFCYFWTCGWTLIITDRPFFSLVLFQNKTNTWQTPREQGGDNLQKDLIIFPGSCSPTLFIFLAWKSSIYLQNTAHARIWGTTTNRS